MKIETFLQGKNAKQTPRLKRAVSALIAESKEGFNLK